MKDKHIPRLKKITTGGPFAGDRFLIRCHVCGIGTRNKKTKEAAWEAWRTLKARGSDCVPEGEQPLYGFRGRIIRKEGRDNG